MKSEQPSVLSFRPSKIANWMKQAEAVSERSHDAETKVGAILVKNDSGAVIAQGYNGFVRGADDTKLPNTRPEKYPYMVHAEQNLIANCARHGISMDNTTLIITLSPCTSCMRLMWQAGITRVICRDLYRDVEKILEMSDLEIDIAKTEEGYYELQYGIKSAVSGLEPFEKIKRLLGISSRDEIGKSIKGMDIAHSCEEHAVGVPKPIRSKDDEQQDN